MNFVCFLVLSAQALIVLAVSLDDYWDKNFGVPGADGLLSSITEWNGSLYFGGRFTNVNGIQANYIVRFDGTNWHNIENIERTGSFDPARVNAIVPGIKHLYIGGMFTGIDQLECSNLALWDGTNWSRLPGQINGGVVDILPIGDEIVIGGDIRSIDNLLVTNVARWNGISWQPMGAGLSFLFTGIAGTKAEIGVTRSLALFREKIYAFGHFTNSGGCPVAWKRPVDGRKMGISC